MIPDYKKDRFAITSLLSKRTRIGRLLVKDHGAVELADCRDIWCRDFMPIQTQSGFVQFNYSPEYLLEDPDLWETITPPGVAYPDWLPNLTRVAPIVADGGSIIGDERVAFVSKRVASDNPYWTRKDLAAELTRLLDVQKVVWVPEVPGDFSGHLDGIMRIIGPNTIALGVPVSTLGLGAASRDHYSDAVRHSKRLRRIVTQEGFDVVDIPDASHLAPDKPEDNAFGLYANFLQLGKRLWIPAFQCESDSVAQRDLEAAGVDVTCLDVSEFVDPDAEERSGGAVNCVTWCWKTV